MYGSVWCMLNVNWKMIVLTIRSSRLINLASHLMFLQCYIRIYFCISLLVPSFFSISFTLIFIDKFSFFIAIISLFSDSIESALFWTNWKVSLYWDELDVLEQEWGVGSVLLFIPCFLPSDHILILFRLNSKKVNKNPGACTIA